MLFEYWVGLLPTGFYKISWKKNFENKFLHFATNMEIILKHFPQLLAASEHYKWNGIYLYSFVCVCVFISKEKGKLHNICWITCIISVENSRKKNNIFNTASTINDH